MTEVTWHGESLVAQGRKFVTCSLPNGDVGIVRHQGGAIRWVILRDDGGTRAQGEAPDIREGQRLALEAYEAAVEGGK